MSKKAETVGVVVGAITAVSGFVGVVEGLIRGLHLTAEYGASGARLFWYGLPAVFVGVTVVLLCLGGLARDRNQE